MDWQTAADSVPSGFITEANIRTLLGKPPATGAWRDGDPSGGRRFASLGAQSLEFGGSLPAVRVAYETWGRLNDDASNAVLILHALTGDSHVTGEAGPGHPTSGWWSEIVGPGLAVDTDTWFVLAPNMLGGCQGTTGPASSAPDGQEWGSRFPYLSIRDQVSTQAALADSLGIRRFAAIVGGSMGGMQALEWAAMHPDRTDRVAILAAPAVSDADEIALNSVQVEAIRMDEGFQGGDYYDAKDGDGPHRGLALARRLALLSYRSPSELNHRFSRSWQSDIDPLGAGGRFAVESYLDFHGNKFTRRFDANSYLTLANAMSSHDVGRGRGGVAQALSAVTARSLVVGIDSDRLFPMSTQLDIATLLPNGIDGKDAVVISSDFGHDGFLIEHERVGVQLRRLLES
ncbi:homoserine O-acetyltransferase MetX [Terrimesophilobacter mesophilus]|uniref:Homoserine O-acetyltransferase n=1 Tax=Terrimesophilobacter mesophilus TaxID=433647 RepID=A0A4R8VBI8_9MICO|nr:homoserine O-acetyltransferase [Terrimesophilobacter mesophilus]TFB80614.1 homoserine O-acetyltransferase [Terrimesophilobacter mesophilus]